MRMPLLVAALVVVISAVSSRPESHRVAGTISRLEPGRSVTIVGPQFNPWGLPFRISATTVIDGDREALLPGAFITVSYRIVGDSGQFAERIYIR